MATFKQYELKDGSKRWQFKAYLGIDDVTGKQVTTTRRGFKSKKEAVLQEKRLQHEVIENGGLKKENPTTFGEVTKFWLENYRYTVKASTYSHTIFLFDKHIIPKLGKLKISSITTTFLQGVVNDWHDNGSNRNYPLFVNYINKVFKFAINTGTTSINPTLNLIMPKKKKVHKSKIEFYSKEQLQIFLTTIKNYEDEYFSIRDYAIFRMLAFSGARIGEILALTWDDLDMSKSVLTISKTLTRGEKRYISETPKTKKSHREIPLDEITMQTVKRWKMKQREYLFKHGYNTVDFVFSNNRNEFLIPTSISFRLKLYIRLAELPTISLHKFRHTHASLLFEAGASVKEVQERLGHSDIKTTMDIYTHVSEEQKEKTVEKLVSYVNF